MQDGKVLEPAPARTSGIGTLDFAWGQYRGWAFVARKLQSEAWLLAIVALALSVIAALFGAMATSLPESFKFVGLDSRHLFSLLAAIAAALLVIPAVSASQRNNEADQIRARGIAETIKGECFRYAAGAWPYGGLATAAQTTLRRRVEQLNLEAAEADLSWREDPKFIGASLSDDRMPIQPLTLTWYRDRRIRGQITFFRTRQNAHEKAIRWLKTAGWICTCTTVILGVVGGTTPKGATTPWIGFVTTLSAAVVAFGFLDRRKYLAASFAAMQTKLRSIEALAMDAQIALPELVQETENLLHAEHAAWAHSAHQVGRQTKEADKRSPANVDPAD